MGRMPLRYAARADPGMSCDTDIFESAGHIPSGDSRKEGDCRGT